MNNSNDATRLVCLEAAQKLRTYVGIYTGDKQAIRLIDELSNIATALASSAPPERSEQMIAQYDALFQAIGDSLDSTVKIAGHGFSISVKAFVESIRAKGFDIVNAPAQGELSDALPVIRDLDAISMALGARLAQMGSSTIKGHDYLLRDAVMREVMEWRRMWDKNSAARPDFAAPVRGQVSDAADAARWRAFIASPRIRFFGSAGLKSDIDPNGKPFNNYAHFGMEIWTKYGRDYSPELLAESDRATAENRELLIKYADAAIQAQAGDAP